MYRPLALVPGIVLAIALLGFPALANGSPSRTALDAPMGTAITYQGQLKLNGQPVSDHCDIQFGLFDALTGGNPMGSSPQTKANVTVTNGLFTVSDLDFGASAFTGQATWLELAPRCPAGSGGFTTLSPRQPVTPAPAALFARTAQSFSGSLAGDVTGSQGCTVVAVVGGVSAASVASGATKANAATSANTASALVARDALGNFSAGTITANLTGTASGNWALGGNSGTNPTSNYLGTADNQPLELHGNGTRVLRLEPTTEGPNVIGGFSGTTVTAGVAGATIGGGGRSIGANAVTDYYGTVSGGLNNQAGDGTGSTTSSSFAVVGGGLGNTAGGIAATVAGGENNMASGFGSVVGGGGPNTASGAQSTVPGGRNNIASGDNSFAAGCGAQAQGNGSWVWVAG